MTSRTSTTAIKQLNPFAELLQLQDKESSVQRIDMKFFQEALFSLKFNSWIGAAWDMFQVVLSLIACLIYVSETYSYTYEALKVYSLIENIITQFFLIDFLLAWFTSSSTQHFFKQFMTWIDIITILPVYIAYMTSDDAAPNLSILRFVRILRLIRILRTFRMLGGFSGVKRQSITLSLAMLSLIFLAAGVVNILENELNSLSFDCQYINALTLYEPSCEPEYPSYDDPSCDCKAHNCEPFYHSSDPNHKPSDIKCTDLTFFDSLYFIIITIYPVGYGSMVVNNYSRAAIIVIIITSIVVIQMQLNKLSQLYSMISPFRVPYDKHFQDKHVVLCGYVHDKDKLSRFLREFFHPDRQDPRKPGFHLVVLGPVEPSPEIVDIINSPIFEGRLFYIIGSALNIQDLVKARVDTAAAIMFQSNPLLDTLGTVLDDAATVMRTMSAINFNADIRCLIQVLQSADHELLKDSDADIVLCMDDYKTTLQARNAMCHGLATFVENIFHSFGSGRENLSQPSEHWLSEYKRGLQMELYYVHISKDFFEKLDFQWSLLVEAIFLEYECMLLGVCRASDQTLFVNPGKAEFQKMSPSPRVFFRSYTTGVLLAPDDESANAIAFALTDPRLMNGLIEHLVSAEDLFAVRTQVTPPPTSVSVPRQAIQGTSAIDSDSISATAIADDAADSRPRSKTLRRMSLTLGIGGSTHQKALANMKESQTLLDNEFSSDLDRKKTFKSGRSGKGKKRNNSRQHHQQDSDSSDEKEEDLFCGYLDSDSDEQSTSDVSNRSNSVREDKGFSVAAAFIVDKNKVVDTSETETNSLISENKVTSDDEVSRGEEDKARSRSMKEDSFHQKKKEEAVEEKVETMSMYVEPEENARMKLSRICKAVVEDIHKKKKKEPWMDLVRGLNIHGERELEDDAFSLNLLQSSEPKLIARNRLKWAGHNVGHSKTVVKKFSNCNYNTTSKYLMSMSSPKKFRAAGKRVKMGMAFNPSNVDVTADSVVDAEVGAYEDKMREKLKINRKENKSPQKLTTQKENNSPEKLSQLEKKPQERLILNQRMRGFEKKKSSSFSENYECSSTHDSSRSITVHDPDPSRQPLSVSAAFSLNSDDDDDEEGNEISRFSVPDHDKQNESSFFEMKGPKTNVSKDQVSKKLVPKEQMPSVRGLECLKQGDYTSKDSIDSTTSNSTDNKNPLAPKEKNTNDNSKSFDCFDEQEQEFGFGHASAEVFNADHIQDHIVVMGCLDNVFRFVQELRKPRQHHMSYHSLLIVGEEAPIMWDSIKKHHDDVYFLQNQVRTKGEHELIHLNLPHAHSLVLLASRDRTSVDEATNIDSSAIFTYLKLHAHVPRRVFFTVELFLESSIGMLNSVVVRHLRKMDDNGLALAQGTSDATSTGLAVSQTRRSTSFKVAGSALTALQFEEESLLSLAETDLGFTEDDHSQLLHDVYTEREDRKKTSHAHLLLLKPRCSGNNTTNNDDDGRGKTNNKRIAMMPQSGNSMRKLLLDDKVVGKIVRKDNLKKEEELKKAKEKERSRQARLFWDTDGTHQALPVFAASLAYVPTGFDSIFCNSFFQDFTPQICEKLICGQDGQTMHNVTVPRSFHDRNFGELFRAMNCRGALPLALYRHRHDRNDAMMSYVYTNPTSGTILVENDRVLVFGNSDVIKKVLQALSLPLTRLAHSGGKKFSLAPESLMVPATTPAVDAMATLKAAAMKFGGGVKAQKVHP